MDGTNIYKFKMSFSGDLVENSLDAFSLANTILAASQVISGIAGVKYKKELADRLKININAFHKGSFVSEFLIYADMAKDLMQPVLPILPEAVNCGADIIASFKKIIEIREKLKGKSPKNVEVKGDGNVVFCMGDKATINLSVTDFKALQDKSIQKSLSKMIDPIKKADSEISEIRFSDDVQNIATINRDNYQYFEDYDLWQVIPSMSYKGSVSKIDTKAKTGFLDVGARRFGFSFSENLSQEQFEILVESLKTKVQIILSGEVAMDYESNPRSMQVVSVAHDVKLFD